MATYLKTLGMLLVVLGIAGSLLCWRGAVNDEAYHKARLGVEKYPGNMLYTTELRVAEPRHMLLLAGAYSSAPIGLVLGSICVGVGSLLAASSRRRPSG